MEKQYFGSHLVGMFGRAWRIFGGILGNVLEGILKCLFEGFQG